MLTSSIAQEIARETSAIIGFNVLITDGDGIVIGSGDIGRIGSFHEASVDVMRTLRPASHGAEAAHRLIGVQPGITLPILLNNDAVGTVGITGDPDQVERFGLVVRNQTEILLRESLLMRSRMLRESAVDDVLRDLAHYDPEITEPGLISFKAHELGYDLRLRRSAVVIDIDAPKDPAEPRTGPGASEPATLRSAVFRTLRRTFPDSRDLVGTTASGRFVVLHHLPALPALPTVPAVPGLSGLPATGAESLSANGLSAEDRSGNLLATCRSAADDLLHRHGIPCRIGVGGVATSVAQLHDSYRDATNALYLAGRLNRGQCVTHIGDVRIHDLLATVAHGARARFANDMIGPLREQPGWTVTRQTITAWCESGFNLVQASTALHIHRNTLVYRLNKIETLLGPGFRDPRTCLTVYLACLIDELEDSPPA